MIGVLMFPIGYAVAWSTLVALAFAQGWPRRWDVADLCACAWAAVLVVVALRELFT